MDQSKRQRLNERVSTPAVPLAAKALPVVAPPPAAEPLAEASEFAGADILSQHWHVFGNDPNDARGIRSVLLAGHSRGKPEELARVAFP